MQPGPRNLLTDVDGLTVGNAVSRKISSGVTVVVTGRGMTAACDVRGGAPGTRETDALQPGRLVDRVHAVVLSGGSVFGLAAADAVVTELSVAGRGLRLMRGTPAVPIVPAAVIYDLANRGRKDWGSRPPYYRLGVKALQSASKNFKLGSVGAGIGATAGIYPGGLGSASLRMNGVTVAALIVVNPVGSPYMPDGQTLWAWPFEIGDEFGGQKPSGATMGSAITPMPADTKIGAVAMRNTMIGVVATDAALDNAECDRLAKTAHDGFARAVHPSHTLMDGDTVFALSSGRHKLAGPRERKLAELGSAGADCVARAVARGVYFAAR